MQTATGRRTYLAVVAVFLLALLLAFTAQWCGGAYQADLAGHPDEAAHYVTGLMVRDYAVALLTGNIEPPIAYARRYYAALPRVALGHYPPGFYLVEALWLLPAPGVASALLLQAALSAALSAFVFATVRPHAGTWIAAGAAVLLQALPWLRQIELLVMSDLLVCLLALAAGAAWNRFLDDPTGRRAGGFGLLAAAAILTKGTALFLALLPPLSLLLARRWELLRRPALYLAPVPVLLLAAPWMLATYGITQEGMATASLGEYLALALPAYGKAAWPVLVPLLPALAVGLLAPATGTATAARRWAVFALAGLLFTVAVPSGIDARYLLPTAIAGIIAAALGVGSLAASPGRTPRVLAALIPGAILACWLTIPVPIKLPAGFAQAAEIVGQEPGTVLVISDARGEGAFIAEIARREPRPGRTVLRSSKEMAASDWLGRGYESSIRTPEELDRLLTERRVAWVVVDLSVAPIYQRPHHLLGMTWAARGGPHTGTMATITGYSTSAFDSEPRPLRTLQVIQWAPARDAP